MTSSLDPRVTVRQTSIDHHDDVVAQFEEYYRILKQDRFANAFAYGRHKIDVLLTEELKTLPKNAKVLDVGCGTGAYLRRFAALGLAPVGVEPAPTMLEIARRQNPDLTIKQGIATELPFDDQSFDAVTAIEVLRYLHPDDARESMREMHRVLKPGGFFFVTLVNRYALDGFYVLQRVRQMRRRVAHDRRHPHCEFTTPRGFETMLHDVGFHDVRTMGCLFAPVRMAYKLNEKIGSRIASAIETADDRAHASLPWLKPLAGHLIAVGRR